MSEATKDLSMRIPRWVLPALMLIPVLAALVLASCAAPLYGGTPRAQKHENRREIDQLEDAWRIAVLKGNTSAMESLLADDYMGITPNGTLQSTDQALANLRTGMTHITALEISDRKVRFYGTTALVTSRAEVSGTTPQGDISGSYRYIRVYVRTEQGAWKIVSFEASRIRDPDEHK
jgi:ketosteroid isomerase-like protein